MQGNFRFRVKRSIFSPAARALTKMRGNKQNLTQEIVFWQKARGIFVDDFVYALKNVKKTLSRSRVNLHDFISAELRKTKTFHTHQTVLFEVRERELQREKEHLNLHRAYMVSRVFTNGK